MKTNIGKDLPLFDKPLITFDPDNQHIKQLTYSQEQPHPLVIKGFELINSISLAPEFDPSVILWSLVGAECSSGKKLRNVFMWVASGEEMARNYETLPHSIQEEITSAVKKFTHVGSLSKGVTSGLLNECGDFNKIITLIYNITANANGCLVVKGIENDLHRSLYGRFCELLITLADNSNCQIFFTTYSEDFLKVLLSVAGKKNFTGITQTNIFRNERTEKVSSITMTFNWMIDCVEDGRCLIY